MNLLGTKAVVGALALGAAQGLWVTPAAGAVIVVDKTSIIDDASFDYPYSSNFGNDGNLSGSNGWGLLGFKDLFTLLPPTSNGDEIVIDNATLKLYGSGGANTTVKIYRMTSQWMILPAGQSEANVSASLRDIAGGGHWAAYVTPTYFNFGSGDYDTVSFFQGNLSSTYNGSADLNITSLLSALYDSGVNQGFAITAGCYVRSSESAGREPVLTIDYHYQAVPEPAALSLLALGGLALRRRR